MAESEYVCIDSRAMRICKEKKQDFINRYNAISVRYDWIIRDLSENWKGEAAELFLSDASVIRKNIGGIADILSIMCSTLDDVIAAFSKTDASLGEFSRSPSPE